MPAGQPAVREPGAGLAAQVQVVDAGGAAVTDGGPGQVLEAQCQRTGLATDEQLQAAAEPLLAPVLASGRYPAFARWAGGRTAAAGAGQFDYTLGCLLDGIAAHLA